MYFWIYGARNTSLEKCLKSPLSEDSLNTDMVNGSKHCRNLNDSTFTIFIDPCEQIQGWKSLSDWCAKSYDCSLTHSQPMTSILFLTEAIYCNIFRCIYHRNEKYFVIFFFIFQIWSQFWTFSKKRWPSEPMYFCSYGLRNMSLEKCLKSPLSEESLTTDMVNGPKHCWNLNDSTFTIFIDPCEDN